MITAAVPQVATGQGVWTALPQLVADELGAAWETIGVEPAPLTGDYGNPLAGEVGWLDGFGTFTAHLIEHSGRMRITAGSTSVRAFEQPLRETAALARAMLVGAAPDRWGRPRPWSIVPNGGARGNRVAPVIPDTIR